MLSNIHLSHSLQFSPVFTTQCYASEVLAADVCPSVHLSVTSWYCIKTTKCRITQTMPHDSPGTL